MGVGLHLRQPSVEQGHKLCPMVTGLGRGALREPETISAKKGKKTPISDR